MKPDCLFGLCTLSFVRRRRGLQVVTAMRRPGRKRTDEMAPPETPPRESSPHDYVVISSRRVFIGRVAALRSDQVAMPGDVSSQRDVVELPGAVGIVALDEKDRVLLVRQYRHPVHRRLWEIPAGLLA